MNINFVAMVIGYYTIGTYLLGTLGMLFYLLVFKREMKKHMELEGLERFNATKWVFGLGYWWWAGCPIQVPIWLIGIPFRRRRRHK